MALKAVIFAFVDRGEVGMHSLKRQGGRLQSCFFAAHAHILHVFTRAAGSTTARCIAG